MMRARLLVGLSTGLCAAALFAPRDARACGGCFHPPTQVASDITDERMLLSVSTTQTTLYDQIRYAGTPSSFAWVLPIHGTVDVGLSADVLFDSIDTLTATQIVAPNQNCAGPPADCAQAFGASNGGAAAPGAQDGVTVTKAENVGPYETVQLHSTDGTALNNWLSQNGFDIPADVAPVIAEYVKEGFDFLAMKLLPNQGVQAMRPVRVTSPGASLSLPLRMAAIGTGATVGITLWVVADGRYEPQNFPFFHIDDKDLVWDWSTSSSNYTTLRAQNAATYQGKGWEIESSLALNEQLISSVIYSGGQYFGGLNGGPQPVQQQADAGADYLPIPGDPDAGADGGAGQSASQVRDADIAALFAGMTGPNVRVTRMRSDISHAAMNVDFVLRASADQSELSNVRTVTQQTNLTCPVYDNCTVVGYAAPGDINNGASAGGGSSGCAATTGSSSDLRYAALFGAIGLAAIRLARSRKAGSAAKARNARNNDAPRS